jgi:hypothetical protein
MRASTFEFSYKLIPVCETDVNLPGDIAAELPAPRDDEPESLRRDIVDELADHLQCALHRELLANQASPRRQSGDSHSEQPARQHPQTDVWGSPNHAWQQVLTRFGNPATIARRLWFDAMKERLMAQKTMAAALVLAAVALCVMTAMTWSRSREDRQFLLETFAANREMMQQMSRLQEQMLRDSQANQEALKSLATADVTNPEWVRDEVIVHLDSLDGPPAAGVDVRLTPNGSNTGAMEVTASTDANGRANLGLLRAARYLLTIRSPGGELVADSVSVYPGMPFSDVVVMPSAPCMPVDVTVNVEWPKGLDGSDVWLLMSPQSLRRYLAGREWREGSRGSTGGGRAHAAFYAISPAGKLYEVREPRSGSNTTYGDIIRWQDEDATAVTTMPLPDREFRFGQISFVVFSQNPGLFESDDVRLVVVPNATLHGPEYQQLTEGPDPMLTIRIPDSIADTVRDFRNEVRRTDAAVVTDEEPT